MKRIISLLLALALVLTCGFGTAVFAAEDESESGSGAEVVAQLSDEATAAKRLLEATGAQLPTAGSDGKISRGAFLVSLISALKYDIRYDEESPFADIESDTAQSSAANYAVRLGIISGGTEFEPDRNITYAESIKMIVTSLGYGEEALAKGGYPGGYLRTATTRKIDRYLSYSSDDMLTEEDFYLLMRNFLEVPARIADNVVLRGSGSSYKSDLCLLEFLYDWTEFDGVITGDENTFLYDSNGTVRSGSIQIDDTVYVCDEDYILGSSVTGWSEKVNSTETVVFMELSSRNDIVEISASDFSGISSSTVTSTDDNAKKHNYALSGLHSVIYNGKFYGGSLGANFTVDVGGVTLVDNNSDGRYEVVIIRDGGIMNITNVNDYAEKIYDSVSGDSLDISADVTNRVYSGGALSSAAVLRSGDVVEYYKSKDGKFNEIRILKDSVTGTLNGYSETEVEIDGKAFEYTKYFETYHRPEYLLGKENTFILTESGDIAAVANSGAAWATLAYVSGYQKLSPLDEKMDIRLFNEYGEYLELATADKVKYNGNSNLSASELFDTMSAAGEQVITYKLDAEGKICFINTENSLGVYDPTTDSPDELKRYNFDNYDSDTASKVIYKSFGLFIPYFTIDSATKIISVSDPDYVDNDKERFSIGSTTTWNNDATFVRSSLLAYNVEACGRANILVVCSGSGGSSVGNASAHGVVESIRKAIDNKGSVAHKITVCAGNQYKEFFVSNTNSTVRDKVIDSNGKYLIDCGDVIRYTADPKAELTDIALDFDYSEGDVVHAVTRENHEINYYYGTVNATSGSSVNLLLLDSSNTNAVGGGDHSITLVNKRAYVWLVDTERKKVTAVSPSSVISAELDSANPDKMLLKTRYAEVTEVVIYR